MIGMAIAAMPRLEGSGSTPAESIAANKKSLPLKVSENAQKGA